MFRWQWGRALSMGAALCLAPAFAGAQAATGGTHPTDPGEDSPKLLWALGAGAGVVDPETTAATYWSLTLRRRLGRKPGEDPAVPEAGLRAYLEAEYGHFSSTTGATEIKDDFVGLNLVGVVPARVVDIFLGIGFGPHFQTTTVGSGAASTSTDATHFGANAQFGVELKAGVRVGFFGAGRLDVVSGTVGSRQSKIWGGVRYYF
jgi:hypothetical protein